MDTLIPWLVAYLVVREVYFLYSHHILINKLMSRNYHEFKVSKNLGRIKEAPPKFKVQDDLPEDLGVLQTFTG